MDIKNQRGFTVLELIVVLGISSMLCYAMYMGMRTGTVQIETSEAKMTIQDSAREGLYKMVQELRLSSPSRITIGGGGASVQFNVPDPNNPTAADYTTNWAGSHLIQYSLGGLNGRQILRANLTTGGTTVIANDVTALTFAGNASPPNVVTVTMSVQRSLINTRTIANNVIQFSGQAEIRNP